MIPTDAHGRPLAPAGFWLRTAAHLVDAVLVAAIVYPLLFWIYGGDYLMVRVAEALGAERAFRPVEFLLQWVAPAVAVILFWTYRAATPGKMAAGVRIVDARTGGPLTPGQSALRYVVGYAVAIVPLGLGLLWVAWDPRKQGWHDKLAHTLVVHARRGRSPAGAAAATFSPQLRSRPE